MWPQWPCPLPEFLTSHHTEGEEASKPLTLPAVGSLKRYSRVLEYEYRVKTAALGIFKRYSILSLTLYLEWYCTYSILYSGGPH
jgi:hypothetical protein